MANIHRSRKSGFTLRSGVMRRDTLWSGINSSRTTLGVASTAALINSAGAGLLALRPFTIVRSRLNWHVASDQEVASEVYGASLAAAVVTDQASAIGITAVLTPETDQGSDSFFVFDSI